MDLDERVMNSTHILKIPIVWIFKKALLSPPCPEKRLITWFSEILWFDSFSKYPIEKTEEYHYNDTFVFESNDRVL